MSSKRDVSLDDLSPREGVVATRAVGRHRFMKGLSIWLRNSLLPFLQEFIVRILATVIAALIVYYLLNAS